jgi:glycosyltransferase involved in cell wall biosynthesis
MAKITIGVPTRDRYDVLTHCLLSIAMQTLPPVEVIIMDDTSFPINITTTELGEYVLRLLDEKGIKWKVLYGQKKGQHYSHQTMQEIAEGDFIYRVDDDEIMEPDCLEKLSSLMTDDVGAVAPCVLLPDATPLPNNLLSNSIRDIRQSPNIQWFKWKGVVEVDHLYSSFLYRKNIVRYDLSLSCKAHREESIFTYSLKRAGYKLLVNGDARVWHWRSKKGGIRSDDNKEDYHHDEGIFEAYLSLWNVSPTESKMIVLDSGIGDHWAFKNILPEMKEKYKKLTIAACFPDVFWDEPDITLISIADAKNMYGDIGPFQVYKLLWDTKEKIHLIESFKRLYL